MKHTYSLEIIHDQFVEAVGGDVQEFTWKTGRFHVPHPLFIPDDVQEKLTEAKGDKDMARALLGDEEFEKFTKLDGRPTDVALLWRALQNSMVDDTADVKATPTLS